MVQFRIRARGVLLQLQVARKVLLWVGAEPLPESVHYLTGTLWHPLGTGSEYRSGRNFNLNILDSDQVGEPMALGHSIALEGAQIQIDSYLEAFREPLEYSLLRADPR